MNIIDRRKNIIIVMLLTLLAFAFSFQCSNNLFHIGDTAPDSSVFKYVARVIIEGGMPYKDTFDHKGPLIYLLNVIGIHIGKQRGIWVVELVAICLTFFSIYMIARLQCSEIQSLLITVVCGASLFKYFQGGNLVEEYALPFIGLSIYIFSDYFNNRKITDARIIFSGVAFGAVCILRLNLISVWAVMCIGVVLDCLKGGKTRELLRYIGLFVGGACIIFVPAALWLIRGNAFGDFIDCYWTFNRMYSATGVFAEKRDALFTFLDNSLLQIILIGHFILTVIDRRFFNILYSLYVCLELVMISLSGNIFMHYGMVLVPLMAYPISCMVSMARKTNYGKIILSAFAIYVMASSVLPIWHEVFTDATSDFVTRENNYINEYYYEVKKDIDQNTLPSDGIIVCDNDDMYYNLSNRFAATRFSYMTMPLIVNEEYKREFYNEINNQPPKLIVLPDDYYDYEKMANYVKRKKYSLIDCVEIDNNAKIKVYLLK